MNLSNKEGTVRIKETLVRTSKFYCAIITYRVESTYDKGLKTLYYLTTELFPELQFSLSGNNQKKV
jgi:hypothetical protein